jgi:hypothetical protein
MAVVLNVRNALLIVFLAWLLVRLLGRPFLPSRGHLPRLGA